MKHHFTKRQVLDQVRADLIGKDSYRGVTFSYTWLANQFGHISLGFIPTFILYLTLVRQAHLKHPALIAPQIISAAWLVFETYNFLGPLLLKKHSSSKMIYIPGQEYTFQPDWVNISFDTLTDLGFFWFGSFFAGTLCRADCLHFAILTGISILLIYPTSYWYPTKIYLQAAQYPYQLRLAQCSFPLSDHDKQTVQKFLKAGEAHHLFIFGAKRCGKTSLAVGIATELSIKHYTAVYTTSMKLYRQFFETAQQATKEGGGYWSWRDSEILVIDDINPGDPVKPDLVTADTFHNLLNTFSINPENCKTLAGKKVIWVMGSEDTGQETLQSWMSMLNRVGVINEKILSINLPAMC